MKSIVLAAFITLLTGQVEAGGEGMPGHDEAYEQINGEQVTIHVVTHSHLDAGWVYDVDTCYKTVEHIFSSVLIQLMDDKEKTYTVGDLYFFKRWYETKLDKEQREEVKKLVQSGQFEIVSGGAVSTDEATTTYQAVLDNMIFTRQWVNNEFGVIPKIGWQLDAFGHSAVNARLFAEMGMEALVYARMPFDLHQEAQNEKKAQFLWQPDIETTGADSPPLFVHKLYDHYNAPNGINVSNGGYSMKSTQKDLAYNKIPYYVKLVRAYGMAQAKNYLTNNALLMFGDDFSHPQAHKSYHFMDEVIASLVDDHWVTIKYSTVENFLASVKADGKAKNIEWPTWKGDMFPQFTDMNEYWSGYYTDDPAFKKRVRDFSSYSQAIGTMYALQSFSSQQASYLISDVKDYFTSATVNYHHDAITGTHFPVVGHGYDELMRKSFLHNDENLASWVVQAAEDQGLEMTFPDGVAQCRFQFSDDILYRYTSNTVLDTRPYCQEHLSIVSTRTFLGEKEEEVDVLDKESGLMHSELQYTPQYAQRDVMQTSSYIMAVYNPALKDRQSFSFRTNNTHVEVSVWDETSLEFVKVEAKSVSSICEGQRVNSETFTDKQTGETTDTCDVFVTYPVQALSTSFFEIKHDKEFLDTVLEPEDRVEHHSIENVHTKVIVDSVDLEGGIVTLRKIDKQAEKQGLAGYEQVFTFQLGYYDGESFQLRPPQGEDFAADYETFGKDDPDVQAKYKKEIFEKQAIVRNTNMRSGHYSFATQAQEPESFAWFRSVKTFKANSFESHKVYDQEFINEKFEGVHQIIIEFEDKRKIKWHERDGAFNAKKEPGESGGFIKLSLLEEWDSEGFLRFDVLVSDSSMHRQGFDLVAIWESVSIENYGEFYTDENSLELMKRIKKDGYFGMDVPANYYPITSMISVRDSRASMTVLNDRAQGGSSLKQGRVELAINRKTTSGDYGGMGRSLQITGEVICEFYLHFDIPRDHKRELASVKDLFARLLPKNVLITRPLMMWSYHSTHAKLTVPSNSLQSFHTTRTELLSTLKSEGIVDLQLYPAESIETASETKINVRVVMDYDGESVVDHAEVTRALCQFALWKEKDDGRVSEECSRLANRAVRTSVSGDQILADMQLNQWNDEDIWKPSENLRVQAFEVTLSKNDSVNNNS